MSNKQTAVDWLIQNLIESYDLTEETFKEFEQAKEMEKQQIGQAYEEGTHDENDRPRKTLFRERVLRYEIQKMSNDKALQLLKDGASQAEQQMIHAMSKDEFVFAAGQYSAMAAVFVMVTNNVTSQMASLAINDRIDNIAKNKYGKGY